MKILHYSLGFPPYRTGGLTKYCTDLMLSQLEEGHQIGLIWPGEIIPWVRQRIKQHPDCFGLKSYEIINPLPVALDEGIVQPEQYMKDGDTKVFEQLFMEIKPNVLHIHTLMGLPPAMLKAAKACNVRTVFTTHDYYGICPKVTLFHNGQLCDDDHNCADCVCCNQNGLSMRKIAILQSRAYRQLKNSAVVKTLRRKHRTQFFEENSVSPTAVSVSSEKATQYIELRRFYLEMLSEIDIIHFNSTVARDVYLRYFTPRDYRVISITHRDIHDNRKAKNFDCDKLRITYLAPAKVFKGYALLKSVLDYMWDDGEQDFELRLFNIVSHPVHI